MPFDRRQLEPARAAMQTLVAEYEAQRAVVEAVGSTYSEAQARIDFINKMLRILGWDVDNDDGKQQGERDVVVELNLAEEGSTGRPDYRLRAASSDRLPVEAKKPSVKLSSSPTAAAQARAYGFTLQRPATVLTNFRETVFYDSRLEPQEGDSADVGVLPGCHFTCEEYVDRFDELWSLLSYESVASEQFYAVYDYEEPPRGQSPFDVTFLAHFRKWRLVLAQGIADENPGLGAPEVGRRTQRLLNALLFLRVCEDRNIGRYKDLLAAAEDSKVLEEFARADSVFNAGMFSVLTETLMSATQLTGVIREMYWPQSKFAYALLEADTLSAVYEQYLAERVVVDSTGRVLLEPKPELTHSGGVVPTPIDLVERLVEGALGVRVAIGTVPEESLRVLDPAAGSGIFLVETLRRLIAACAAAGHNVDLARRAELAKRHLYGVDLDGEAVEVAKLSLLLVVLGDDFINVQARRNVLPDLSRNLRVGNSLVGTDYDKIFTARAAIPELRAEVAPFDWSAAFPAVLANGGFDCIIGNPPFVRIQVLADHLPDQLAYFQDPRSKYKSVQGNFDAYMLFIERSLSLLHPEGTLALVVKNSLVTSPSAAPLRRLLGPRLLKLVHFGSQQLFPGRQTYACLVIASGQPLSQPLELDLVDDVDRWRTGEGGWRSTTVERGELTGAPWVMASAAAAGVFAKMEAAGVARLGDPGWVKVFVGVQTSADDVFYVEVAEDDASAPFLKVRDIDGRIWPIERGVVKKVIRDRQLAPYGAEPESDYVALFPYDVAPPGPGRVRGRATLLTWAELSAQFPLALAYFQAHETRLRARSVSPDPQGKYWAYGRSQSLVKMAEPKIINRTMSVSPQYVPDASGLVIPGGGDGGPYTLLRPEDGCPLTPEAVIAILSHPLVDAYIAARSKEYRGAYVVHRKATLEPVPLPLLLAKQVVDLTWMVNEVQGAERRLRVEVDNSLRSSLHGRREVLINEINQIVTQAYGLTDDDLAAIAE